jgi:peptidoglycan/xylan/chitin deacetylase (PgdA/CDA1 family)
VGTEGLPYFTKLAPEQFEAQIRYLRRNYRIVSLDEVCKMQPGRELDPAVAITFDDGYRDLYTNAFPILQKYCVPATIYLTVGSIESGEPAWYDRVFLALKVMPGHRLNLDLDGPRSFDLSSTSARLEAATEIVTYLRTLPDWRRKECCAALEREVSLPQEELNDRMLDWEQVRTMHQAGICFGSHTMNHPVISRVSSQQMERELLDSKRIMEQRIGAPVEHFAYPFGRPADCGTEATEVLRRLGYRSAVTTTSGFNTLSTDPFRLRRVQLGEDQSLSMFACRLSQVFLGGWEQPADSVETCVRSGTSPEWSKIAEKG